MTRSRPKLPLSRAELQRVLRPFAQASMLPPRAYYEEPILAWERESIFARSWICVGREADIPRVGDWFVYPSEPDPLIVVRGDDNALRAFHNVCPHRGARLVEQKEGYGTRFRCPYHGWIFSLKGQLRNAPFSKNMQGFNQERFSLTALRTELWQGFVFVCLSAQGPALLESLGDLPAQLEALDFGSLRRAYSDTRTTGANWKLLMENFAESHHFAIVHPELERLTPSRAAGSLEARGPWQGGTMELTSWAETVSLDGKLHNRPLLPGTRDSDRRTVRDYLLFPNLLLSVQPDYLLSYRIWPLAPDRTRVDFDIHLPAAAPQESWSTVVDFWKLTNDQDQHICEQQQRGVGSRGFAGGCYVEVEDGTHLFDCLVAQALLQG